MPPGDPIPIAMVDEGRRMASICNACRYCEGYCAVFPALERRLEFGEGDLTYLANLCHNCGACYYACQYAPPHEFALNFPRMMAEIRNESYRKYAWPGPLARAFPRNGRIVDLVTATCVGLFLLAMVVLAGGSAFTSAHPDAEGAFYALLPHTAMAWTFGIVFLAVIAALVAGSVRFWRDIGEEPGTFASPGPFGASVDDVLKLKYLDGGGDGCTYPGENPSHARKWFHQLTFYGFMLCFAATCVATVYHYVLGRHAPYPFWSAPVVLGTLGGIGLLIGPAGLLWLRRRRDPALASDEKTGMDAAFTVLLFAVSLTGLLLLAFRETRAMGVLLAAHLGTVMGLFLTMPCGKFVHAVYRFTALVRYHVERRRPLPELGSE